MEAMGARVALFQADVSSEAELSGVFSEIARTLPPLRGVIHAAGVIDDAPLLELNSVRLAKVMAPKVAGAFALHRLTRETPLDFFVLFSSVSSVLGSPGQGNYAAANAFMDALAHHRRSMGLPASCINWGPWSGGGMAGPGGGRVERQASARGVSLIAPERGLAILDRLLALHPTQAIALSIRWATYFNEVGTTITSPFYAEIRNSTPPEEGSSVPPAETGGFARKLEAAPPASRRALLLEHVQEQVIKVLGLGASHVVDWHRGFADMGMDSLMGVELRTRLQVSLGHSLRATLSFDYPNVELLVEYLAVEVLRLGAPEGSPDAAHKVEAGVGALEAQLNELSDEELARLVAVDLESDR
jgi:hypothetical protein